MQGHVLQGSDQPAGNLYLSSTSNATKGKIIAQDYMAFANGPWIDVTAPPYNVKDDGVTDSSAAIQAALNVANGVVYLPMTAAGGNYYIGTTQLLINRNSGSTYKTAVSHLVMAPGTRITYIGTDAAIKVDVSSNSMTGLILDLYDIYSTGAYGLKFTSGGLDSTHYIIQSRIKIHNIWNYTTSGIYVDCLFSQNVVDVLGFYPTDPPKTAWGLYFTQGEGSVKFESNQINVGSIYSYQGLYGGVGFNYNSVNIDVDSGTTNTTIDKIDVAGIYNTLVIRAINPVNQFYPGGIRLRSTSANNALITPPPSLALLSDDSPIGSNTIISPIGLKNILINSSFEIFSGALTAPGWTATNIAVFQAETTNFKHGLQGAKLMPSGNYSFINQALSPSIVAGKTFTFAGWFKAPATNLGINQQLMTIGDDTSASNIQIATDGRWHYLASTYAFGVGTTNPYVRIWVGPNAYAAGDILYADGCSVVLGTTFALPEERTNIRNETYGTTAPGSGTWMLGDICWNTNPSAGGTPGWVCTTGGTPGTWKAMANLAP